VNSLPRARDADARSRAGGCATRGLVRALCVALGAIALLVVLLSVLFSSPDVPPSTIAQWARQKPVDFLKTVAHELYGTSVTAEYGPPYNHNGDGQHAAFLYPQKWLGVTHPIDTARDYVIAPLRATTTDPALQRWITEYETARAYLQADGIRGYEKALEKAVVGRDRSITVRTGEYENVNNMMSALLRLAQSGGLEDALLSSHGFLQADFTKPLLFMADGEPLEERARHQRLLGGQWGLMDETGGYPGQAWLWPYAFWYRIEPFKSSPNADILVILIMTVLSLAFVCVPFIPGVRDIPRWIPLHRLSLSERYGTRS